ncbi:MAG: acetyltransferase [Gammaproteobacteria bacterium]|nr:acetyltransferase [Gammaproteobacteria bacterium]
MDLLIVGAGGMAREVFCWLSHDIENKKHLKIKGFLSDRSDELDNYPYPVKIIGGIENYAPKKNECLVMGIMNPNVKKIVAEKLLTKGASFYTLIHPSAIVGQNVKIGQGCVIAPNCIITSDITIGNLVFLNIDVKIGHDTTIGNYTSINGWSGIAGNVYIGEECLFGIGSIVIPKRKIGNNAKIGAGSVVINHVKENITVFGNPAKTLVPKNFNTL